MSIDYAVVLGGVALPSIPPSTLREVMDGRDSLIAQGTK